MKTKNRGLFTTFLYYTPIFNNGLPDETRQNLMKLVTRAMSFPYISETHFLAHASRLNERLQKRRSLLVIWTTLFIAIEYFSISALYFLLFFYRIREEFGELPSIFSPEFPRLGQYLIFYGFFSFFYFALLYRSKLFAFRMNVTALDECFRMAGVVGGAILLTIGATFLLNLDDYSRLVILLFLFLSVVISSLIRLVKRLLQRALAAKGLLAVNTLIVGAGQIGRSLAEELIRNESLACNVIGYLDDDPDCKVSNAPVLGKVADIFDVLKEHPVDEVIITIPSERELVNRLITELRKYNLTITIIPDMFNLVAGTVQIGRIHALPMVTLVKTPMRGLGLVLKRCFDFAAAALLVAVLSPFLMLVAILIKLDSEGPVFYKQQRVGRNGRLFYMYKFRSMRPDADQLLKELWDQNEADGIAFKIHDDPRVTRLGRFLRKYSIDELPQLFNVLKGDMSLVGPRPPLPIEVEHYGAWEWRRLEVTPGITGLWQVSGRSDLSFSQWVNLDIYYIENWSLILDLKILLKTIPVVIRGEGAY